MEIKMYYFMVTGIQIYTINYHQILKMITYEYNKYSLSLSHPYHVSFTTSYKSHFTFS